MLTGMRAGGMAGMLLLVACGSADEPAPDPAGDAGPCADDAPIEGCPCLAPGELASCYEGPSETAGIGACASGTRTCDEGAWGPCEGQVLPVDEVCNGIDDDCDGDLADDPVLACGDCDPACELVGFGPAEDRPFDDPSASLDGAELTATGDLSRGGARVARHVLWTPATGDTMARVDTQALAVVGEYLPSWVESNVSPTVAATDYEGNAYFGNRFTSFDVSVTKVSYECVDADRDGTVETSSGPGDVLDFEDDECVPWRADVTCDAEGGDPIGCEEARTVAYGLRVDGDAIQESVWVGTWRSILRELDAETGEETGVAPDCAPCESNGAAVDRDGIVWVDCGQTLCRFDPRNPDVTDSIVRPGLPSQDLTIDLDGNVWTAGYIARYEPGGDDWTTFADRFGHGVAATADGDVYVGACPIGDASGSFCRIDGETDEHEVLDGDLRILAVDDAGRIWGFHTGAWIFDPGTGSVDPVLDCAGDPCVYGPYNQSDMTGTQLLASTDAPGDWRAVVEGCAAGSTTWKRLDWEADAPDGAAIRLRVRAAGSREALAARAWATVEGPAPADLETALGLDRTAPLLEVRVTLAASSGVASPVLRAVRVHRACE